MQARLLPLILKVSVLGLLFSFTGSEARADNGRHKGHRKHGHQGHDKKHGGKRDRRQGYPGPYGDDYSYYPPSYGGSGQPDYSPPWDQRGGYFPPAYPPTYGPGHTLPPYSPPSYGPGYGYPPDYYEDDRGSRSPRYYTPRYRPRWYPHESHRHDDDQGDDDQGDDD